MAQLAALNEDYIGAVQHSDVKRFDEMLSDDHAKTTLTMAGGREASGGVGTRDVPLKTALPSSGVQES
ncbi:MAG: hypothetical protein EXQ51_07000 [Acidobacteria bacterium]|nr:hypothetical protein [Acidobacteriota bacterium]